jgi:drug/metabolite transporter (DMT)-like permease
MRAWLSYVIVSLVWGSTFLAIAYAVASFTPMGLSAARFIPAGLLALMIGRARQERPVPLADVPPLAVRGVLLLTVCMALIAWSEERVPSGLAAVTAATVPLFLALLEPGALDGVARIGLGVGFLGVVLLVRPAGNGAQLMGVATLLGSASLWSWGTLYGKRHPSRAGHFTQVGVEMLAAGLASLVLSLGSGGLMHAPLTARSCAAIVYLLLGGSIVAYSAYIHLASAWPAAKAGTYAYWNPLVALLLGCTLRGERFGLEMLPGLGLILVGVVLVQAPWRAARRRAPSHACSASAARSSRT